MKNLKLGIVLALGALFFWNCSKDSTDSQKFSTSTIVIANGALTNQDGQTMYIYAWDVDNSIPNCTGDCLSSYELVEFSLDNSPDISLLSDRISVIPSPQNDDLYTLAMDNWPLYYYKNEGSGSSNADGSNMDWFVAKLDYTILVGATRLNGADVHYLITPQGETLYQYGLDNGGISACSGGCISEHPPVRIGDGSIPKGLNSTDFGVIVNFTSGTQSSYLGKPIYTYSPQNSEGVFVAESRAEVTGVSSEAQWSLFEL